ncbi:anaerobic ribonucleoside-triphosphate reductase activating protein [Candidatus Woesearchaeota archaeon]|nr:anaerobic ribonucleoside-triphosphate reductase activating protein [Candidatus Woesearchaeota archaeon]
MQGFGVRGMQLTSMVDFPPHIVTTLFLGGCNMRCPFCYNLDLALRPGHLPAITTDEVMATLSRRRGWIDGVCITGGEPTLSSCLPELIQSIKVLGLLVKLDTNGTNPQKLTELLPLVDYVAMDVKASKEKYERACGARGLGDAIGESIRLIQTSAKEYEFRTTVVPQLHDPEELLRIGSWIKGSKRYFLQTFVSSQPMICKSWQGTPAYSRQEMLSFREMLLPYAEEVDVR